MNSVVSNCNRVILYLISNIILYFLLKKGIRIKNELRNNPIVSSE